MSKLLPQWQRPGLLEAVFDQLSEALILYDRDLVICGVNRAAERLFGLEARQMVGRSCREVFRCTGCEGGCGLLEGFQQPGASVHGTVRLRTEEGSERLVLVRTALL